MKLKYTVVFCVISIIMSMGLLAGCAEPVESLGVNEGTEPEAVVIVEEEPGAVDNEYLNDIAYHLELSALGKEYQDMSDARREELLSEYGRLLDGFTLISRESADGTSAYIAGVYKGTEDSPLKKMYSISMDGSGETQLLYTETEQEEVDLYLAGQKQELNVGQQIKNSSLSYFNQGTVLLIQPKNVSLYLDGTINRYLHTPSGPEYIRDAVSRGITLNNMDGPYLRVYRISEKYGEIFEDIALTEEQYSIIMNEERVELTDGFGFAADLNAPDHSELFTENAPIPPTVLDLAVEYCDYRFGDPSYITDDIREARLDCDWLDEPVYAAEEDLPRLREILKNAEHGYVGACGYGAKLTLNFVGGEKLTMFKGTDSCDTIVFGSYGGYFLGDKENQEFWQIFGMDVDTKEPLIESNETASLEDAAKWFFNAYISGNSETMQEYLADSYAGELLVYEGIPETVCDVKLKGLENVPEDADSCGLSWEFRASPESDSFIYLTMELVKQANGWKISFYGLER